METAFTKELLFMGLSDTLIAGSSKCMTKDLLCLLTMLPSTIKDGLVRYCNTNQPHWCQQHLDSEELNKFVVIT